MPLPPRRSLVAALVLLLCLLPAGCKQVVATLGDMSKLQAAIGKEYHEKNVNINLSNSSVLTVTFINSPLNDQSVAPRLERAQRTAQFVVTHYPPIGNIREIWVGFVKQETRYLFVTYTQGLGYAGFDNKASPLQPEVAAGDVKYSGYDPYPQVTYSPSSKESDISIMRIQLEGDLNDGVALAPHFSVPGDATGLRRSKIPPAFVGLDFASFSANPRFPAATKVTLSADGNPIYEVTDSFASSKQTTGSYSEFLLLHLPYEKFLQLTKGETLTVRLGEKTYELTEEQRDGLRAMTAYVKN